MFCPHAIALPLCPPAGPSRQSKDVKLQGVMSVGKAPPAASRAQLQSWMQLPHTPHNVSATELVSGAARVDDYVSCSSSAAAPTKVKCQTLLLVKYIIRVTKLGV